MKAPTEFESAVLAKLLDGEHAVLSALRQQVPGLTVRNREQTGVGFYTEFGVASDALGAPVDPGSLVFGDVEAEIEGLEHGAGFLLYVKEGRLHMLEGFTYDEAWPSRVAEYSLYYREPTRNALLETLESERT